MGFSRQQNWSGLPHPPGDLPNPEIKSVSFSSPPFASSLSLAPPGKPFTYKELFNASRKKVILMVDLRESFPRQVDKKSRGPQGERGLGYSRRKKGQTLLFFLYIP